MATTLSSWRARMQDAVLHMEGAHEKHPGVRQLTTAIVAFEACASGDDEAVCVEAHFRRAQCACYQGDDSAAARWLESGKLLRRSVLLDPEQEAQVSLLEAVVVGHLGKSLEAGACAQRAWEFSPQDAKLRGDIAMYLGHFFAESQGEFYTAAMWYRRAVEAFRTIPAPALDVLRSLALTHGSVGVAIQRIYWYSEPEAQQNFREAEMLFTFAVHDAGVQKAYWYERAFQAFRCCRVFDGLLFFYRALRLTITNWWKQND